MSEPDLVIDDDAPSPRDELVALLDEVERLQGWKSSATEVLSIWEKVHVALGRPGRLGESKGALERVAELEAQVARVEALALTLARFDCLEDDVPRGVDVPDDYEAGVNDSGRRLRAALAGGSDD